MDSILDSRLKGVFQITGWDETPVYEGDDGQKMSRAAVTLQYTGAIEGEGSIEFVLTYLSSSFACFVGFEKIIGIINGQSGEIIVKHDGTFENGIAKSQFSVMQNSGKDELINCQYSGSFVSGEAGKANYQLVVTPTAE